MSDFQLQTPVADSTPITHSGCVKAATSWLSNKCNVILPEFFTHNNELCDVIGFRAYGHSLMIECKAGRGDFLVDKRKSFRIRPERGMGDQRYYCCPAGLIKANELPDKWVASCTGITKNCEADTPEDALVLLALELFNQGILKREAS